MSGRTTTGRTTTAAVAAATVALATLGSACARPTAEPPPSTPGVIRMSGERQVLRESAADVVALAWADGGRLAVVTRAGEVLRLDPSGVRAPDRLDGPPDGVAKVAADPASGVVVAWAQLSGRAVAWNATGERLGTYEFGYVGIGALAVREGGDRFAVVGGGVSVVAVAGGEVVSRGERPAAPSGAAEYQSAAYRGDRVVAWIGANFTVDVWDVSGPSAAVTAQDCGCSQHSHTLDPAAGRGAFTTETGTLILWDVVGNRAVGRRAMVSSATDSVQPLAVVRDRYVLYTISRDVGDGRTATGPLMAWDATGNSVTEVWTCPGCEVRAVLTRPGSDEILLDTASDVGDDHALWTATLTVEPR